MTAAPATNGIGNYHKQFESVSLNTVGAVRVVRRHEFANASEESLSVKTSTNLRKY